MNLAHCIHGLGIGGAQKVIALIVRGQREETLQHFVYTSEDGIRRKEIEEAGATVRIIPRHVPKLDPLWAARLASAMRGDRIDLVHTHLFGDSLHGYLAARSAGGLPVVMTLHSGIEGLNPLQRLGYPWLIGRCTRAVACSRAVRRSFLESGIDAPRLTTISNGIEIPEIHNLTARGRQDLREGLGAHSNSVLFASIGRLANEKGYRYLIAAFSRLYRESGLDVRLALVGDGPLRGELERQVDAAGSRDRVLFAGFRSDISLLLQVIDVVVFSSLYEGLPLALLEAMAAGRCIIGTQVPGIAESVRDGHEALLVPSRSVGRLGEALHKVAASKSLRSRLGESARKRFLEEFTAERMVRAYCRIYREAVNREE